MAQQLIESAAHEKDLDGSVDKDFDGQEQELEGVTDSADAPRPHALSDIADMLLDEPSSGGTGGGVGEGSHETFSAERAPAESAPSQTSKHKLKQQVRALQIQLAVEKAKSKSLRQKLRQKESTLKAVLAANELH